MNSCSLCISLGESSPLDLLSSLKKASQWADLLEVRLDKFVGLEKLVNSAQREILFQIQKSAPCPIIWTLRKKSHGGEFDGTEEERLSLLSTLFLGFSPDFIDLEGDIPKPIFQKFCGLFPDTEWIISWHDLKETPKNLDEIYNKISLLPASYYKIATYAQTSTDALRMLNFTQKMNQSKRILCGLCMGERGQLTRILSPIVGSPFTFASLENGKEVAPGQLSAEELISVYRFKEMNRETKFLGLIGRPVIQSLSPLTHNAVLKECSINGVYLKFYLNDEELPSFFHEIQSLPVKGLSVTMPFKERVLSLLKPNHSLPACNTLLWKEGQWLGCNTDGIGALEALGLPNLCHEKIVILGAGGTAKAIAYAAQKEGVTLAILNRTVERAQNLALPLGAIWGSFDALPKLIQEGFRCIIQTTSVGMAPAVEEAPIPLEWIPNDAIVLDVISHPSETKLLCEVKRKGGQAISGKELFIHQAIHQFIYWFGSRDSNSYCLSDSGCITEAPLSCRFSSGAKAPNSSRSERSALCNAAIDRISSENCCLRVEQTIRNCLEIATLKEDIRLQQGTIIEQ